MARSKTSARRSESKRIKPANRLKHAELKLEKKKKELLGIKALHKKVAGEFIDLWVETNRLKRQQ